MLLWLLLAYAFADCRDIFSDEIRPEFAPQLVLSTRSNIVTWKHQNFHMPLGEFSIIQVLVTSLNEIVSYDELINKVYGFQELKDPKSAIKMHTCLAKKRFRNVDPWFSALRTQHGEGLYWYRTSPKKITRGKLSVCENFNNACYDKEQIKLTGAEHKILVRMLKFQKADRDAFGLSLNSVPVIVCTLNAKLSEHSGRRLVVIDEEGLRLNPDF